MSSPIWLRIWRLLRLFPHIFKGFITMFVCFRFWGAHRRMLSQQRWAREFLQILGVGIEAPTELVTPGSLLVSNHISWVDILVFMVCYPIYFVAKDDVAHWPLIGYLVRRSGAVFIQRRLPSQARFANAEITRRLEAGDNIMLFPEGTTTDGTEVLPFYSPLFQPAVHARRNVYPLSLDYLNADGSLSFAPAYPVGVSLPETIWKLVSQRCTIARVHIAEALQPGAEINRKKLAQQARDIIIRNRCHTLPHAATNDPNWEEQDRMAGNA